MLLCIYVSNELFRGGNQFTILKFEEYVDGGIIDGGNLANHRLCLGIYQIETYK